MTVKQMKFKKFSYSDFNKQKDLGCPLKPLAEDYFENKKTDDTRLKQILGNTFFDKSSFKNIITDEASTSTPLGVAQFEYLDLDPVFSDKMKTLFKNHKIPVNDSILSDLVQLVGEHFSSISKNNDPILKIIDTSTPIAYWKSKCPELFDYPEKMHGYKTSWEFLKGVYNPSMCKTLYYNDLKEINHKLYRAVYRHNKKEKFLPTHNDRVAEEVELMKSKNIELSDIKDPKLKEKYRMRMQHIK